MYFELRLARVEKLYVIVQQLSRGGIKKTKNTVLSWIVLKVVVAREFCVYSEWMDRCFGAFTSPNLRHRVHQIIAHSGDAGLSSYSSDGSEAEDNEFGGGAAAV